MSERWIDSFSFRGRLSRSGQQRLERRFAAVGCVAFFASMGLLIARVPPAAALIPFGLGFLFALFASVAAGVRRLHDVGRHARGEAVRGLLVLVLIVGPAAGAFLMPGLPDWAGNALLGASGVVFLLAVLSSFFRGAPEWKTGDEGPNEFGAPPLR